MTALKITSASFENDVIKASHTKPVLVDFWAEWCGPCRMVGPILEEISNEHGDKITIGKLNSDEESDIAARYMITSIPTMLVFVNGEPVKQMIGAKPKRSVLADLSDYIN